MKQQKAGILKGLASRVNLQLPKAVVFDFDGVVLDSLGTHISAWDNAAFVLFQLRLSDKLRKDIRGESTIDIAHMICADLRRKGAESALMLEKNKQLLLLGSDMKTISGLEEFLQELDDAKVPYGVASNAPYSFLKRCINELKLPFKTYLGRENVENPKPAPDLFLACAERLGFSGEELGQVIGFEDSLHGVQAIVSAGMISVGVCSTHPSQTLIAEGALFTIDSYFDLPL